MRTRVAAGRGGFSAPVARQLIRGGLLSMGRAVALCAGLAGASSLRAGDMELRVDCSQAAGEIRPLHGGNCGPLNYGETVDLTAYHRELAIPYTRLHDCLWPNPDVVDIHAVFPDFRADPERPESFAFARTDDYLKAIVAAGSKIVYRLGESIEHSKRKYHVAPPADPDRWAAVCLGLIRHYNEGWANGFRYGIRYWEIWNEPENRPNMWTGTDDDYFRLYAKTARAIKTRYPDLLVGGPAVGDTGRMAGEVYQPSAFIVAFLEHCKRESLPLDFFSWHMYTAEPRDFAARARGIRALLDRYGFAKTESHLNEWNYLPGNNWGPIVPSGQGLAREKCYAEIGGAPGAAFVGCALLSLQDSPVDVANYYTAEIQGFGLFNLHGVPKKTFYAFKAFRLLLDTPVRVAASGGDPGRLAVCAGTNRDKSAANIMISHFRPAGDALRLVVAHPPWEGPVAYEVLVVNAEHDLRSVRAGRLPPDGLELTEILKAPSVGLIRLRKPGVNE